MFFFLVTSSSWYVLSILFRTYGCLTKMHWTLTSASIRTSSISCHADGISGLIHFATCETTSFIVKFLGIVGWIQPSTVAWVHCTATDTHFTRTPTLVLWAQRYICMKHCLPCYRIGSLSAHNETLEIGTQISKEASQDVSAHVRMLSNHFEYYIFFVVNSQIPVLAVV